MADEILPFIAEEDYADFQKMMPAEPELPPTYKEWKDLHTSRKRKLEKYGDTVKEIPVRPKEFQEHCDATGRTRNCANLLRFARDKAQPREAISDYDPLNGV
jgi:hypothetical protein